ncbi:ankyrin [Streptomyces sp. PRh5]|uniref:ankyrin repeat domain-containing protein n=1 Tax=Streptomyces sp. PRh5 TaxID=1158056 RepID=UPI000448C2AE|nr:ankyrin repeat domain-containing protein [Streptomyces sp. PRh5]EXU66688.1 ankyrin [Streptomyces sp. PRh5]
MDFLTEEFAKDVYLGGVATRLPGARFGMLPSAAPPHQEVAFAILELPPRSTPDPAGRTLLRACAAGDVDALRTALDEGADVGTLDEYGATPLHHAVAARSAGAVDPLLAAGADPRAQAAFGNAPRGGTAHGTRPAGDAVESQGRHRVLPHGWSTGCAPAGRKRRRGARKTASPAVRGSASEIHFTET